MFNINSHERSPSNVQKILLSNKKPSLSPVATRQNKEKSPSVDKNIKSLIPDKKISINSSNPINLKDKMGKSKNNSSISPTQRVNPNQNNRSISKDKNIPVKKVNLLQSYYSMKNSNNSKNPTLDKKNTSTSRDKNNLNNLNQTISNQMKNNPIASKNVLSNSKKDSSSKSNSDKLNSLNCIMEDKKKLSISVVKNLHSTAKSNSKSPSVRVDSKSPNRISSKSPNKENIKKPYTAMTGNIKNVNNAKRSPSPNRIPMSEKKVSLIEKYQQLKGIEKSPMTLKEKKPVKLITNIISIENQNVSSSSSSNNSSLLGPGDKCQNKNISFEDYKKHLEENSNLKKKLFEKPGTSKEKISPNSNNNSLNKSSLTNATQNHNNNFISTNTKKNAQRISSSKSREKNKKAEPNFKEMNTSPLVTKVL
jgi:hypothetical protein